MYKRGFLALSVLLAAAAPLVPFVVLVLRNQPARARCFLETFPGIQKRFQSDGLAFHGYHTALAPATAPLMPIYLR